MIPLNLRLRNSCVREIKGNKLLCQYHFVNINCTSDSQKFRFPKSTWPQPPCYYILMMFRHTFDAFTVCITVGSLYIQFHTASKLITFKSLNHYLVKNQEKCNQCMYDIFHYLKVILFRDFHCLFFSIPIYRYFMRYFYYFYLLFFFFFCFFSFVIC